MSSEPRQETVENAAVEPRLEAVFETLQKTGELTARGIEELREEFRQRQLGHVIPKMLDLNVNSENLAKAFARAYRLPLYPFTESYADIAPDTVAPPLPPIAESGEGYLFCKNGVLYVVNPLDPRTMSPLTTRLKKMGLRSVGIVSRARYLTMAQQESEAAGPSAADQSEHARKLNDILLQAVRMNASDIHFEPQTNDVRVRFRVDNGLREVERYLHSDYEKIANIILTKCKKGKPGTFNEALDDMFILDVPPSRRVKMRVMMIPVTLPERQSELPCFCLRVLGNRLEQMNLRDLGIPNTQKNPQLTRLRLLTERKNGLILVSGPTGSGKTTTLTAVLAEMQRVHPNRCRYTAEDPVEMNLTGVNHVQVNEEMQLSFARAVKSFLRGDPDEVLIGEIRDVEVAAQALTASITGHLVFSTIHTNSAIECVSRLIDIGCDSYIVASALKAATAQRLVRRLCPHCSVDARWGELVDGSHPMLQDPENAMMKLRYSAATQLYGDLDDYPRHGDHRVKVAGPGCKHCDHGYRGRILITELFEVTPRIQDLIANKASVFQLKRQALREGFKELWQHGMNEIAVKRTTSMDEMISAMGEREAFAIDEEPSAASAPSLMEGHGGTDAWSAPRLERGAPEMPRAAAA